MPIDNIAAYAKEMHAHFERKAGQKPGQGHPLRFGRYGLEPGWDVIREEAGWHILGEFPSTLIARKYPTEDQYWYDWRIANYQPITRGPAQDTLKNITRFFAETSPMVVGLDEQVREYVGEERFEGMDFWSWMIRTAWTNTPLDPNGLILAFPYGPGIESPAEAVDVAMKLIESAQLYDFIAGKIVSFRSHKSTKGHALYWVIDDEWYYHVEEIRTGANRGKLEITPYYQHGQRRPVAPPAQVLGGIRQTIKGVPIYRSFFEPYFPFGNEAAKAYSTYQVVAARHGFPIMESDPRPCDYIDPLTGTACDQGYIHTADGRTVCRACDGSGFKAIHPSSTVLRMERPPDVPADGTPVMRYIEMPGSLKDMAENWQRDLELAKEALNKRFIEQAQSGVAKEMDREGEYNFLQSVADWFFATVMENTLKNVSELRQPGAEKPEILVVPPTDFKIKTASDLLDELKSAREAGTTSGIYVETAREYAGKKYARDPDRRRKLELQLLLDPMATLTEDERQAKRFSGGADDRAIWINANAYSIIEEVAEERLENLEQPDSWWRQRFAQEVDARRPQPPAGSLSQTFPPQA